MTFNFTSCAVPLGAIKMQADLMPRSERREFLFRWARNIERWRAMRPDLDWSEMERGVNAMIAKETEPCPN